MAVTPPPIDVQKWWMTAGPTSISFGGPNPTNKIPGVNWDVTTPTAPSSIPGGVQPPVTPQAAPPGPAPATAPDLQSLTALVGTLNNNSQQGGMNFGANPAMGIGNAPAVTPNQPQATGPDTSWFSRALSSASTFNQPPGSQSVGSLWNPTYDPFAQYA